MGQPYLSQIRNQNQVQEPHFLHNQKSLAGVEEGSLTSLGNYIFHKSIGILVLIVSDVSCSGDKETLMQNVSKKKGTC